MPIWSSEDWDEVDPEEEVITSPLGRQQLHWVLNWGLKTKCVLQVKALVAQSCTTFCDTMNCSLPGSSVHGIVQARILEWVAISFSKYSHKCLLILFTHLSCQSPYESTKVSHLSLLVPKHSIQLSYYFLSLFFHLANCFINTLLRIFTYLWNNWSVIFFSLMSLSIFNTKLMLSS